VSTSNEAKDSGENTITAITAIKVHTVIVVLFTVKALFISFTFSPFFIYKTLGKLLV
jgi:hypothetical protein